MMPEGIPLQPDVGVIALVPENWNSHWQPRHHVLTRLARYFWVRWMGPSVGWRDILKERKAACLCKECTPPGAGFQLDQSSWLFPLFPRSPQLERLFFRLRLKAAHKQLRGLGARKIVLYLWRPEFASALDLVPHDLSCYHIDDEYSFSEIETGLDATEVRLIKRADQVILHSLGLFEKKGKINSNTSFVPNGVDFEAYSTSKEEPGDLQSIPHPRIGYTGWLKKNLDWGLLQGLAACHQDWSFVFVGPQSPHPKIFHYIREMHETPNVFFLGAKSCQELAAYPQHFDICIMPYLINDYTKYIYPLKLHEYLASGRPTVGTRIRSLEYFSHVVGLASDREEWSRRLNEALLPVSDLSERRNARQLVAKQHDWEALVGAIARLLAKRLGNDTWLPLAEKLPAGENNWLGECEESLSK